MKDKMKQLILILFFSAVFVNAQSNQRSSSSDFIMIFSGDTTGFITPDNNNATTDVGTEADATTGWSQALTSTFESQEVTVNVGSSALYCVASANSGRMYIDIHNEYDITEGPPNNG